FEPPTAWFVAKYSIQLSYARTGFLLENLHPETIPFSYKRNYAIAKSYLAVIFNKSKEWR
ncbi:hypothetical protein VXS03_18320, partial [Photobacterium sp. S4TG1]|uniref:hypothetical protein n=1 Tax=Photobacterium sp. S4TG1 TaxID=3114587 RepID=UPI002E16D91E|nr:hypothetical protein [Photobacterium sp. S4TG1]